MSSSLETKIKDISKQMVTLKIDKLFKVFNRLWYVGEYYLQNIILGSMQCMKIYKASGSSSVYRSHIIAK